MADRPDQSKNHAVDDPSPNTAPAVSKSSQGGDGSDDLYPELEVEERGFRLEEFFRDRGDRWLRKATDAEGRAVVVKRVLCAEREGEPGYERELKAMQEIGPHENVIELLMAFESRIVDSPAGYLVHPLVDTLNGGFISERPERVRAAMRQLLTGLAHIHSRSWRHYDIAPSNLLISEDKKYPDGFRLRICDFGFASTGAADGGTPGYRAPEVLDNSEFQGPASDIWSAGCVFAEWLLGCPLFPEVGWMGEDEEGYDEDNEEAELRAQFSYPRSSATDTRLMLTLPPERKAFADPLALALASSMLDLAPWQRPSAEEALKHPYFATASEPAKP